jgi:hypothetical protein
MFEVKRLFSNLPALTLISSLLIGSATARAEDGQDRPFGGHGHDGKFFEQKFEESDMNKDGKLSWDEFKAAHEKQLKRRFKRVDANGDGSITKDESEAARAEMKKRFEKVRERRGDDQ